VCAQLVVAEKKFADMIPIHAAAAISNTHDHEDRIDDPMSYTAATESPLPEKLGTAMNEESEPIRQRQVVGDFVKLPDVRQALPSRWVYKIMCDAAGNVQQFTVMLVWRKSPIQRHRLSGYVPTDWLPGSF
jgi:hypothetical protein